METPNIFLIALTLAVDAFAVALAVGLKLHRVSWRQTFRLSFHFGFFQGLMTFLGWSAGLLIRSQIEKYDHWVAFILLSLIGLHMIFEAIRGPNKEQERRDPTKGATMVVLSLATSIDALVIGLTFSFLNIVIWWPVLIIGIITLLLTAIGLHLGKLIKYAKQFGESVEILGGLVLIAIGVKILIEHY